MNATQFRGYTAVVPNTTYYEYITILIIKTIRSIFYYTYV